MDKTLNLPLSMYVVAVVFFPAFGMVFLLVEGHWSAAFLTLVGMAYAVGLGRVLLWRQLGRPAVPTRKRARQSNDSAP